MNKIKSFVCGLALLLISLPAFSQTSVPGYTPIPAIVEYEDGITGDWTANQTDTSVRRRLTFPVTAGEVVVEVTTVNGVKHYFGPEVVPVGVTDIENVQVRQP